MAAAIFGDFPLDGGGGTAQPRGGDAAESRSIPNIHGDSVAKDKGKGIVEQGKGVLNPNPRSHEGEDNGGAVDEQGEGVQGWTRVRPRGRQSNGGVGPSSWRSGSHARAATENPNPRVGVRQQSMRVGPSTGRPNPNPPARVSSISRPRSTATPHQQFTFNVGSPPKSWKDICSNGRSIPESCKLQFFPSSLNDEGNPIVRIPTSVIQNNASRWESTLSGYVIGNRPFYGHLKACVSRLWRLKCSLDIFSRDNGFFFFKFGDEAECERVLQGGPWLFDGRLIVLRKWSATQGLDRDLISEVPVWIRFNDLSLKYWSGEGLGRLASSIGKPLCTDAATANLERISYARVFVEIKANSKLPTTITVEEEEGGRAEVAVEYEWIPPSCEFCRCFGHPSELCKGVHEWREKTKSDDGTKNTAPESHEGEKTVEDREGEGTAEVHEMADNEATHIIKEVLSPVREMGEKHTIDENSSGEEEEEEEIIDTSEIEMGGFGNRQKAANSHISDLSDPKGKSSSGWDEDWAMRPTSPQGTGGGGQSPLATPLVASGAVWPLANTVGRESGSLLQHQATTQVASGEAMPAANISSLGKSGEDSAGPGKQTAIPHISHNHPPAPIAVVNPEWEEAVKERTMKSTKAPGTSKQDKPRKSGRLKSNIH